MKTMTDDEIDRLGHGSRPRAWTATRRSSGGSPASQPRPGASEVVLAVLTDAAAPEVARSRALSRAVAAIRSCRTNPEVALVA